jgi:uncharacterized protein YbaR (Trm112 family)
MSALDVDEAAFLALLRCPLCLKRPALRYDRETEMFSCAGGVHHFPRVEGFPALRPTDTTSLTPPKEA